jgi:lipid A oxidase
MAFRAAALLFLVPTFTALTAISAAAQVELGFYGGYQTAPHSSVSVRGDSILDDEDFTAGWEGRSFQTPPYYGLRGTWWQSETLGFGLDFVHAKVYADDETLADNDYDRLEFTDGINILTVNVYRRWPESFAGLTPYLGGGAGISVPHVEVTKSSDNGTSETFEYQLTGPAVTWMAGASYPISEQWSVFGEYKGTYSMNKADLDSGGTLETDIITNAVNVGISFSF